MKIAIIGAGFSGITTAKTLRDFGHECTVYEKCPDIGGVWSSTRRYPGLGTQNGKDTYHLSDMSMPADFPEWPSSAQVQEYLELYVAKHKLLPLIHLSTEVVSIQRRSSTDRGWIVTIDDTSPSPSSSSSSSSTKMLSYDHVVVANGTFSQGAVPHFTGLAEFTAAGGKVVHTCDYSQLDTLQGKSIVVVGYGRSACDIANAVADQSAQTTVVARKLIWKLPRRLLHVLNYKFLLLTRLGESLFQYIDPSPMESFLHGWGSPIRKSLFGSLGAVVQRQLRLAELDLLPPGGFEEIASSTISLSTEGFYDKVRQGKKLFVRRDCLVEKVFASPADNKPMVRLTSGEELRADYVICGTGFHQRAPFLPQDIQQRLTDERGNWIGLYRHIVPIGIPDLTFNGYNSSLFCATSSEVAALWIAAYLEGDYLQLPPLKVQSQRALARFYWLDQKAKGKTAHGTNTVPFSLRPIDDLLADLRMDISFASKAKQWLLPVDPSAYRHLGPTLQRRIASSRNQGKVPSKKRI